MAEPFPFGAHEGDIVWQVRHTPRSSTPSTVSVVAVSSVALWQLINPSSPPEDVPMTKIKMNANQEYEYINNFKVLQVVFKRHSIDKVGEAV